MFTDEMLQRDVGHTRRVTHVNLITVCKAGQDWLPDTPGILFIISMTWDIFLANLVNWLILGQSEKK